MSDLLQLKQAFRSFAHSKEWDYVEEMQRILDKAQNAPPEGHGDGSIPPVVWTTTRDFLNALREYRRHFSITRDMLL